MSRYPLFTIIVVLLMSLCGHQAHAQSEIMVRGKVTSRVDKGPLSGVEVYIFKTVGEGVYEYKRAEELYESGYVPEGLVNDVMSRKDGEYELTVPSTGSLLFYKHPFKPVLVKVRGRTHYDVVIEDTRTLDEVVVVEEGKKMTKKGRAVGFGNNFEVRNFPYFIKKEMMGEVESVGRSNARLVTQMFLTDASGKDTLQYFLPRVYDGEQFHNTQYHWRKDILYDIADKLPRLETDRDSVMFNCKFKVDRPEELYFCKAHVWIEDYIKTYYRDTLELLNTGRVSRPFQFLQYSVEYGRLDPQTCFKAPRREMVATPKNMKLKFRIGSAALDKSDVETMRAIDSLRSELSQVCVDPTSTLREIHFKGYASPDGPYEKNKSLSQRRTQTVLDAVISAISPDVLPRVYRTSGGDVASWSDVADILESESFKTEADQIRAIVKANKDINVQGAKIRRLPFFKSRISPLLPQLRLVKCEYLTEVLRYLTPEEILRKYNTDSDYRDGRKSLTLNEYWHLFRLVEDKAELESLYRRALKASYEAEREYWVLPANELAVLCLERKQVDTLILKPFIDEQKPLNYSEMDIDTGERRIVNAAAVIANQVQMHMLSKNYVRAEELSSIIENVNPNLRAIVRCIGGYIDLEKPEDVALLKGIAETSPRNQVVINLFSEKFDSTTVSALNQLPREEAVTDYLKAQRLCLQYSNQSYLMKSADFNRDEDPYLVHPDDKEMTVNEEELSQLKKEMEDLASEIELYKGMGLVDDVATLQKELQKKQKQLTDLEAMQSVIDRAQCSVYEAAGLYLKECFRKDKSFILTAKADADINEDLLNDVLGIKQVKE